MDETNVTVKDTIAIIIPVYNAENYISDCLDSIITQSYTNWKAYCINDGSIDNTQAILEKYAKLDKRIKVYKKQNGGASHARNFALEHIGNEKWIAFVDADDFIAPTMYETIINAITDSEVDYVRLFNQRTEIRYIQQKNHFAHSIEVKSKIVSNTDYFLRESVGGFMSSIFIKSSIIKSNGIKFPDNMIILEDQVFSITCAAYSRKILILETPKDYYYYSENISSVTNQHRDTSNDIISCINSVYNVFTKNGMDIVVDNYFYNKYLPAKLERLYDNQFRFPQKKATAKLNSNIKTNFIKLSLKTKIKYLIIKYRNLFLT